MRTYGRVTNNLGVKTWVEVTTDAAGNDDDVWATTLAQCCKLNLGEDPFYAQYGIPAQQSVVTQVYPDYYMAFLQSQFSSHFAALTLTRTLIPAGPIKGPTPAYNISIIKHNGSKLLTQVPT